MLRLRKKQPMVRIDAGPRITRCHKKRKRAWCRYSVRGLFALVLAAALPFWWLRIRLDRMRAERDAVQKLQHLGVAVVTRSPSELDVLPRILAERLMPDYEPAEMVFIEDDRLQPNQLALLSCMTSLEQMALINSSAKDENLWPCSNLLKLRTVQLTNCRCITAHALWHFATASDLEQLDLSFTRVDDDAAGILARFPRLAWLGLEFTYVTDQSMRVILGLSELRFLSLPRGVTASGLRGITRLNRLEDLRISIRKGDDVQVLTPISRLPNLSTLTITGAGLTDAGLSVLSQAAALKRIDIHGGHVSDAALSRLSGEPQFQSLTINVAIYGDGEEDELYASGQAIGRSRDFPSDGRGAPRAIDNN